MSPTLGVQYNLFLSGKDVASGEALEDIDGAEYKLADQFNNLWFKLGVSADFNLTEKIYLRPTILYGIRLNTTPEKDMLDAPGASDIYTGIIGYGLDVKLALGFRF